MDDLFTNSEIAFSQPVINIGRDGGNDIVLSGDAVSDFHAMLHFDSDRWFLTPLAPAYPILVNGHGIAPEGSEITSGMEITISNYKLTVLLNGINADFQISEHMNAAVAAPVSTADSGERSILLSLSGPDSAEIEAGGAVEYEATVTNGGSLVANMQLQLQGVPSSWVQIIPPVLNLNEGRKGTINIRISPPRDSSAAAGSYHLHFVVISPNYPRETGSANAVLTILPYSDYMVTGMTPRRINLSRRKSSDYSDLVVLNNSNATSTFMIRAVEDGNDLKFAYKHPDNTLVQDQDTITVKSGDRVRVPIQVTVTKRPLIGVTTSHYHYYANVNPIDRPGDAQSVIGEASVRPLINVFWLILLLLIIAAATVILMQPRILQFEGTTGKRTEVIMTGDSMWLQWRTSIFASKITIDDGSGEKEVSRTGRELLTPKSSMTYTIEASNIFSNLIHNPQIKTLKVVLIPKRPSIDVFRTNANMVKEGEQLTLSWAVSDNTEKAVITENKQNTALTSETLSGNNDKTYDRDTLLSLKAETSASYDMKSLFVNVLDNHIELKRFTAWVRPNGIAIPEDSDVRRATRWSMLQADIPADIQTIKPASVNPLPAAQSNVLVIPDDYTNSNSLTQWMNPEQQSLSGQTGGLNNSYQVVSSASGLEGLLVSPKPTQTPVTVSQSSGTPVVTPAPAAVPVTSPEYSTSSREFSVKLVEVIEDYTAENGYRRISYFPNYVLQPGEQVLVEWEVEGVSSLKIENLSNQQLPSTGAEYIYPEKSMDLILDAEVQSLKKVFSLPLRVAGSSDDGEGSGLNCELKANATTLAVPGSIMLTWTGGGNNRVQLLSSIKAEEESNAAEAKKEAEAKAAGQSYTRQQNQAMSGGIIGDYLEPAGFMRVDINKQTTFVLNAYDGNNNVICSKSVEVKYTGGTDKLDLNFRIVNTMDSNNVTQKEYAVNQPVQVTVGLSNYAKGREPTGNFMVTDGFSTCTMTYPLMTCTLTVKHPGTMKLTAIYSGDDTYNKQTATGSLRVINQILTETNIQSAYKIGKELTNVVSSLTWDKSKAYGHIPSGTITFKSGSSSCVLNLARMQLECGGKVTKVDDSYQISQMNLVSSAADKIIAEYSGDEYFYKSTSVLTPFITIDTDLKLSNQILKPDETIDADLELTWVDTAPDGRVASGTITLTSGSNNTCTVDITDDDPHFTGGKCTGSVTKDADGKYHVRNMKMSGKPGETLQAIYDGDELFTKSISDNLSFDKNKYNTDLVVNLAYKPCDPNVANLFASLTWNKDLHPDLDLTPTGSITFTIGSGTCALDLATKDLSCEEELVTVKEREETVDQGTPEEHKNGILEAMIVKMLLDDKAADRVQAKYSGDSVFNESTSVKVLFRTLDTKTAVSDPEKQYAKAEGMSLTTDLTWDSDDSVFDEIESYFGQAYANDLQPTGTIKFTSTGLNGALNDVCTWDIVKKELTGCKTGGTDPEITKSNGSYKLSIKEMSPDVPHVDDDRIRAEYSGDAFFHTSISTMEKFIYRVKTTSLSLSKLSESGGLVNVTASLSWDEDPAPGIIAGGTITLKSGEAVCTLDITSATPAFSGCTGSVVVVDDDSDDRIKHYEMSNVRFSGTRGVDIKAEYSGDDYFLPSTSNTLKFNGIETAMEIPFSYKPHEAESLNVAARLSWNKTENPDFAPDGTITFTIGAAKCTLNLANSELSCDADSVKIDKTEVKIHEGEADEYTEGRYDIRISKLQLVDKSAERILAEYGGDSHFNGSISKNSLFSTLDTKIVLGDLVKVTEDRANLMATIFWDADSDAVQNIKKYFEYFYEDSYPTGEGPWQAFTPGGTITISLIGENGQPTGRSCKWDLTQKRWEGDCSTEVTPTEDRYAGSFHLNCRRLLLVDPNVKWLKAEYSGDGFFKSSISVIEKFPDPIQTDLSLTNQGKTTGGLVNVIVNLSWAEQPPEGSILGRTIKLTSGTSTCTLDLSADPVKFSDCTGLVSVEGGNYSDMYAAYTITSLEFPGGAGEDLKAEFSGNYMYAPSVSDTVYFTKVNTESEIDLAYKACDPGLLNLDATLSWNLEQAAARKPSGTVKFTIGTSSFTLDLDTEKLSVDSGDVTVTKQDGSYKIVIRSAVISDQTADRVKAEYSGDAVFNASSTVLVKLKTLETGIVVMRAIKSGTANASVRARLSWDDDEDEGQVPAGTIKFVMGSGSCTLNINNGTMSCAPATGVIKEGVGETVFEGWNMLMEDTSADGVTVEYSGDGFFLPSTSGKEPFSRTDTTIAITEAYKSEAGYANLKSVLSWDEAIAEGEIPTGTLKITVGDKSVIYDLASKELNEEQGSAEADDECRNFTFRDLLFSGTSGINTISIEYSGDRYFNSSSASAEFSKLPTVTTIISGLRQQNPVFGARKGPDLIVRLDYQGVSPNNSKPTGSLSVLYGFVGNKSGTCIVPIPADNADHMVNCNSDEVIGVTITKLNSNTYRLLSGMATTRINAGYDDIYAVAQYLGDTLFAGSTSPRYEFANAPVTMNVTKAVQNTSGLKNVEFTLVTQNGVINSGKIIVRTDNGKSCSITKTSSAFTSNTCSSSDPEVNSTQWVIRGMNFDPNEASQIYVSYDGTGTSWNSAYASSGFTKSNTSAGIPSVTRSGATSISINAGISYYQENMGADNYPTGTFIVRNGSYTCTFPLPNKGEGYSITLSDVSSDCGGGSVRLYDMGWGSNWTHMIEIFGLPIAEPDSSTFTVEYKGDWAYNGSSASKEFTEKVETSIEGFYVLGQDGKPGVEMTLSSDEAANAGIPDGTVTFRLDHSSELCWINVSRNGDISPRVISGICEGSTTFVSKTDNSVTFRYYPREITSEDTYATFSYGGSEATSSFIGYKGCEGSAKLTKYSVTLTPEKIYSDGWTYLNTVNSDKLYPLYPEEHPNDPYTFCNPSSGSSCRVPLHNVSFSIKVETDTDAPALPSDAVVNLSGAGIAATCTPLHVNGGLYNCTTSPLSLPTPGYFSINISYAGDSKFNSAEATINDINVIRIPASPIESRTVRTSPSAINIQRNVGSSITFEASSFEKGNPSNTISSPSYLYYTYDNNSKKRLQTCYGTSCSLEITANTTNVYAEFVGNETYAPSMTYWQIVENSSSTHSTSSPVSISVDLLEP